MKKIFNKIIGMMTFTAIIASGLTSCDYSEDALEPSGVLTSYQLPQGTHDYDQYIVDFYKKNNSCLLYKFTDKDAYWTPGGWQMFQYNESNPSASKIGLSMTPANEQYVGKQIELLKEVWFNKVSEKALKGLLPLKILLCDKVDSCYVQIKWDFSSYPYTQIPTTVTKAVPAWYNFDNICVAYGNENVLNLTEKNKKAMTARIFRLWAEYIGTYKALPTDEFKNAVTYGSFATGSSYFIVTNEYGILRATYTSTVTSDWRDFLVMMFTYPESWLNDENAPEWGKYDSYQGTERLNYRGILTAKKDKKGLYLKRYNMVRQYFIENFDFDPQSIGNSL